MTNRLRALLLVASCLLVSTVAAAQPESPPDPGDRATSFHAVTGPTHENVPGGNLLVGAYAVALVALVGYVVYVGRIQQSTVKDLARIEGLVSRAAKSKDAAGG
jgi:hypothetical protein